MGTRTLLDCAKKYIHTSAIVSVGMKMFNGFQKWFCSGDRTSPNFENDVWSALLLISLFKFEAATNINHTMNKFTHGHIILMCIINAKLYTTIFAANTSLSPTLNTSHPARVLDFYFGVLTSHHRHTRIQFLRVCLVG